MNASSGHRKHVVVVGGGVSGLAAAHRLVELNAALDVTLLEAGDRLGGVLHSIQRDGFLIEQSADNFITDVPWAIELCRRIGFADQLVPTTTSNRGAMVVHRGRLQKIPLGFMLLAPTRIWPLVTTPILSPWGKLRLLGECLVPPRSDAGDESVASFARRRLGREPYERIVQPLVGGIYTADAEKLSLRATLPRFADMERRHGSLLRAGIAGRSAAGRTSTGDTHESSGARYGLFVAPRAGLTSLVDAIAARLPGGSVRLNATVESIARDASGRWQIRVSERDAPATTLAADGVIVATSADRTARLVAQLDPELACELGRIPLATSVVLSLAYRRDQVAHRLDGFGFVVPAVEKRPILAGSFASVKYAGRAPDDAVLVRVFIGGACQGELAELSDARLREIAIDELRLLLGARGEPLFSDIARWPRSMPQYHVGHCALVESIERRAAGWPGLALAGNAYHGVGIPHCIHSGETAAERVAATLAGAG